LIEQLPNPSYPELAQRIGIGRDAVRRWVEETQKLGKTAKRKLARYLRCDEAALEEYLSSDQDLMEFLTSIPQSGYFSLFTMQRVSLWLRTLSFAELSQLNEEIARQFSRIAQISSSSPPVHQINGIVALIKEWMHEQGLNPEDPEQFASLAAESVGFPKDAAWEILTEQRLANDIECSLLCLLLPSPTGQRYQPAELRAIRDGTFLYEPKEDKKWLENRQVLENTAEEDNAKERNINQK
jgi:hypothetical protein